MTSLLADHNMSTTDIYNQFGTFPANNVDWIDFIRLYFSEPVVPGKKDTIRIVDKNDPTIIITDDKNNKTHIDSVHFIHDKNNSPTNTVIIAVDNLNPDHHYRIEFNNGVFADMAGNDVVAVGSTTTLDVFGL